MVLIEDAEREATRARADEAVLGLSNLHAALSGFGGEDAKRLAGEYITKLNKMTQADQS